MHFYVVIDIYLPNSKSLFSFFRKILIIFIMVKVETTKCKIFQLLTPTTTGILKCFIIEKSRIFSAKYAGSETIQFVKLNLEKKLKSQEFACLLDLGTSDPNFEPNRDECSQLVAIATNLDQKLVSSLSNFWGIDFWHKIYDHIFSHITYYITTNWWCLTGIAKSVSPNC